MGQVIFKHPKFEGSISGNEKKLQDSYKQVGF